MKNTLLVLLGVVFSFNVAIAADAPAKAAPAKAVAAPAAAPAAPAAATPAKNGKAKKAFTREYGMAGCGLGAVLMGKRSAQIFAATTNGTLSNQFFGITFGTLNCVDGPAAEVAENMDKFIVSNKAALAVDMVKGQGETLSALHQIMGCQMKIQDFNGLMKSNYKNIYNDNGLSVNELTDNIINVIRDNSQALQSCPQLG